MRKRILIVDDNPMNAHLAKLMLARAGFETYTVEGAGQALDFLVGMPVDVVVTDISMPGMSGKDLCRQIMERYGESRPRLVAFTAFAMEHQKRSIMEAGFDALVVKPVTSGALVSAVCSGPGGAPRQAACA